MGNSSRDDDPGAVSQPKGDGPVTLEDRTKPGGQGSPDTNQGKTEPMSPTPDHPEPPGAPDLDQMNAGAAGAAHAPSHPDAVQTSPTGSYGGGAVGAELKGLGGPGTRPDRVPVRPVSATSGEAHRAGGLNGVSPAGEQIETDTEAGAAHMSAAPVYGAASGQGDPGPSPAAGAAALEGSSETQPEVEGIRLPEQ